MDIVVCIKQVPEEIVINKKTGTLIRDNVRATINPCDKNAIELAVSLKEKHNAQITLVSMGPSDAEKTLTYGLAMGADQAVLLCDKAFAGSDTLATALVLSTAIKKIKHFDLILCGKETIDSGTQQVGPQIAHYLKISQVTSVIDLSVKGKKIHATRELRDEFETLEAKLPVLVTVNKGMNKPRLPTYLDIYEASNKDLFIWSANDIKVNKDQIGLNGSPTKIGNLFQPEKKRRCIMLKGSTSDVANSLLDHLRSKELI